MARSRCLCMVLTLAMGISAVYAGQTTRRFEWATQSAEAKTLLKELQQRIEHFQVGQANIDLARKIVALDPGFAMGQYYLSAVMPGPDGEKEYRKALELAKGAPEGERRFIEGMYNARVNQGADFKKAIEPLEALARDFPDERLVQVILGQLYAGDNQAAKARLAFEQAQKIGPESPRIATFLATDDLLKGRYAEARKTYESASAQLPRGAVPFQVRFGTAFSHLYEGRIDAALQPLRTYLEEYKSNGLDRQFPEVFIWNAMARINLENGRLDEAMKDYERGYESVPGSGLPEDQKQTWYGRLRHGKARVMAKQGKHAEAWAEAESVRKMIEDGGEPAKQYWPAYHYLAGYLKLEAGEYDKAAEHLKQSDMDNPFDVLLLARSMEKLGRVDEAKAAYKKIVESGWPGIERPLAFPEAKRRLQSLQGATATSGETNRSGSRL
jgi:tetratricopeptide (TPR) repeat protein